MTLAAPFPWFGGKRRAAALVWSRFGNVPNYVEPFAGSLAVLLGRPGGPGKVETANDLDAFVANFWRAVKTAPAEVAEWADWPVNEADLHPRHAWLVAQREGLRERLLADPEYSDPKIAGWWVWGISAWIGNGWCFKDERLHQSLPKVGVPGNGIHAPTVRNQRPALSAIGRGVQGAGKKPRTHRGTGLHRSGLPSDIFDRLRDRLRGVRICCGDWMRVLGRSTLGLDTSHGMTPTGVLLDPPYAHDLREKRLYAEDHADLSRRVREWALEHGDLSGLRIALCGYDGEHEMPAGWSCVAWKSQSGWESSSRERIWFSPHCLRGVATEPLFAGGGGGLVDL